MSTAIARPRLFAEFDAALPGRTLWLVAAGGYGKTTLATSYAAERGLPLLHLAVGDAGLTVGDLFYRLREGALRVLGEEAASLPVLNPDVPPARRYSPGSSPRSWCDWRPRARCCSSTTSIGCTRSTPSTRSWSPSPGRRAPGSG
ncbi:MAG: hypothetical protein U5L11_17475 [Arhodomonas sp.]|nr:hypothetical protein [Arhodomonas sp.]